MRAALLTAPGTVELVERELPPVGTDQVQIRITECGVCMSEVDLYAGKDPESLPSAIGHEVAGVVEEVGEDVPTPRPGDHVAAWLKESGGFADRTIAERRYCVPVAAGVRFAAVAEPLACVVNAVELAAPKLGDDVAIIGAGFMGNLIQMVTALKGARSITVVDLREDALARAHELGATCVVNSAAESPLDAVRQITDGNGADVVYEATGVQAGLELAGALTRMSGKLVIAGYHQGGSRTIPLGAWNYQALDIKNAHFRDSETIMAGMRAGMRLVNAGKLDASSLVTHSYGLDETGDAFEAASAKPEGFAKAVVRPTGTPPP